MHKIGGVLASFPIYFLLRSTHDGNGNMLPLDFSRSGGASSSSFLIGAPSINIATKDAHIILPFPLPLAANKGKAREEDSSPPS